MTVFPLFIDSVSKAMSWLAVKMMESQVLDKQKNHTELDVEKNDQAQLEMQFDQKKNAVSDSRRHDFANGAVLCHHHVGRNGRALKSECI